MRASLLECTPQCLPGPVWRHTGLRTHATKLTLPRDADCYRKRKHHGKKHGKKLRKYIESLKDDVFGHIFGHLHNHHDAYVHDEYYY